MFLSHALLYIIPKWTKQRHLILSKDTLFKGTEFPESFLQKEKENGCFSAVFDRSLIFQPPLYFQLSSFCMVFSTQVCCFSNSILLNSQRPLFFEVQTPYPIICFRFGNTSPEFTFLTRYPGSQSRKHLFFWGGNLLDRLTPSDCIKIPSSDSPFDNSTLLFYSAPFNRLL